MEVTVISEAKRTDRRRAFVGVAFLYLLVCCLLGLGLTNFVENQHLTSLDQKIAAIGVGVGLVTLAVVCFQLYIAATEVMIVERQTEILERQEQILGRRAKLHVTFGPLRVHADEGGTLLDVRVHNTGTRAIDKARLTILRPPSMKDLIRINGGVSVVSTVTDLQLRPHYNRVEVDLSQFIYQRYPFAVSLYFSGQDYNPNSPFGWRIIHEDGVAPSRDTYEKFGDDWSFPPVGVKHRTPDILLPKHLRLQPTPELDETDSKQW